MTSTRWAELVADALHAEGVRVMAMVPDSAVSHVYERLAGRVTPIAISREEEGVGVLTGAYLAGQPGVLLLQNTGLGNALNALASLAIPSGIPMLLVVNLRGDVGEFSPAQVPLGIATEPILRSLGIPVFALADEDDIRQLKGSWSLAVAAKRPVAFLLRSTLTGGKRG